MHWLIFFPLKRLFFCALKENTHWRLRMCWRTNKKLKHWLLIVHNPYLLSIIQFKHYLSLKPPFFSYSGALTHLRLVFLMFQEGKITYSTRVKFISSYRYSDKNIYEKNKCLSCGNIFTITTSSYLALLVCTHTT